MNPCALEKARQAPVTRAGKLLYYLFPYRRQVLFANLQQVFPQLTLAESKRFAQAFYSHLAHSLKEMAQLRFLDKTTLKNQTSVKGAQYVIDAADQGKGVLLLTAHIGNWECAPLGAIRHFEAYTGRFHVIRRTFHSKALERFLFKRYVQAGLHVIPKTGSLHKVCDALAQNDAVIFVLDQHASLVNRDGIAVEFFGKKAGTYRSLASLARHTQAPVIPMTTYRLPNGHHVLEFFPPIPWQDYSSTQETLYHNTKRYNEALEQIILEHPEQWVWIHKRWKLREPTA